MPRKFFIAWFAAALCALPLRSQNHDNKIVDDGTARWAVGANLGDAAMFGTIALNAHFAASRHWTVEAWFKYNNWSWNNDLAEKRLRQAQRSVSAGTRYWFWSSYSGWWAGARLQWQEYSKGGLTYAGKEEGDAFGAVVGAGYSVMLSKHWNLDFGLTGWGGVKKYAYYTAESESCPTCGRKTAEGTKGFFLPSEAIIAVMYVF